MKKNDYYQLSPKDKKIIELFTELGMSKNLAKTLTYISQVNECRSSEIEHGANLRQPEVSIAMQQLQNKGWIEKRDLKKEGKGRPVYIYKLNYTFEDIVDNFEKEKIQEISQIKKDITELKDLLETS